MNSDQPFAPSAGEPAAPSPPPTDPLPAEPLAVAAIVLAVVSLLVPVLAGIAALVVAAMAAQRIRRAPAGTAGGRGLVTAALAVATIGLLGWGGLGALAIVAHRQEPASWQASTGTATAGADQFSEVDAPPPTEPALAEPPATEPSRTPPKVASGRVGDRLTAYDEGGFAVLEVTVTRVAFSTGDQFEQPEQGLFLGAHLKVRALADEQDAPYGSSYALVGGHRYDEWLTEVNGFAPYLDPVTLNQGERASGWLVFDVPTRHGQLVIRDLLTERIIGIWKY